MAEGANKNVRLESRKRPPSAESARISTPSTTRFWICYLYLYTRACLVRVKAMTKWYCGKAASRRFCCMTRRWAGELCPVNYSTVASASHLTRNIFPKKRSLVTPGAPAPAHARLSASRSSGGSKLTMSYTRLWRWRQAIVFKKFRLDL